MNVTIEIHYTASSRIVQGASFPLRGRKPERIALEWWKQIKREMSYHAQLEKVIINGDQDITELVLALEKQDRIKQFYSAEDLPF